MNLKRETIEYKDEAEWLELRKQDVTSTDVASLFGISPWGTKFELWHQKKGTFEIPFVGNQRTRWGQRLEAGIAYGAAEEHGWEVEPFKTYGRLTDRRMGSSYDFRINKPSDDAGLLEIKNIDYLQFQRGWIMDSNTLEAPPYIELQVQHEMLVAGMDTTHIAALVGGNDLRLIRREADADIQKIILKRVKEFWDSIDANEEPDPYFPPDSEFVAKLYGFARTGTFEDMSENTELLDLIEMYKTAAGEEREAVKRKKEMKARILMLIGDTEKVACHRHTISAGMIGPSHVEYDRDPYRNFRITSKKEDK